MRIFMKYLLRTIVASSILVCRRGQGTTYRLLSIVDNVELIIVANMRQKLPGPSYFETAIDYLDSRN